MSSHLSTSAPRRGRGRAFTRNVTAIAVTASLSVAPILFVGTAAFAADDVTAPESSVVVEAPTAAPVEAAAAEAPAEAAPVESAPVESAPEASDDSASAEDPAPSASPSVEPSAEPAPSASVSPAADEAEPDFEAAAALAFELTTPANGAVTNDFGNLVFFEGTGTTDNVITVTYTAADGSNALAGSGNVDAVGAFSFPTSYGELAGGAQTVTVTVTQTVPGDTASVGTPIVRTFAFEVPPVQAQPFTVISPAVGETVTTTTPTFTGTGRVGDDVEITYTNRLGETSVAGRTTVRSDGTFSVVTSFLDLTGGVVEVRTLTNAYAADGTPIVTGRISTLFYFSIAPVAAFVPNAPAIEIAPESITVSDVKNLERGLDVTATGFGPAEPIELSLSGPSGVVDLELGDAQILTDQTGSYADFLVLFGDVPTGLYTLTITGVQTGLVLSDTFTVVPDPAPAVVTPITPVRTGNSLASTGVDAAGVQGLLGLGAVLTLAGGLLLIRRRRVGAVQSGAEIS